jgi:methylmalonyl-CoA mutase
MSQDLTLAEFPPVSTEQWEAAIRKDLKGKAPKQKLFYRAEDAAPGRLPCVLGARDTNEWRIRELVYDAASARAALDAGADEIRFVVDDQSIEQMLDSLPLDRCAVHFEAGERAAEVLEALLLRPLARGSVDYEPLPDFDRAAKLVAQSRALRDFRVITIRAHRFSDAGSTIAQELGLALAEGVEIMAQLTDRGVAPAQAASALAFSFGIGSNYFFEIAKLRAARTLWARALESFQPGLAQAAEMTIYARTSHWTATIYDPHVNLLRSTTAAMAAAIGGADALEVEPFDGTYREPGESGRRLARNTQIILKQEAWLDRVVDPAGGSYYVEVLTDSLAREAWKLLQQVEAAGGFLKYAATGVLERDIAKARADREAAGSTRRCSIVGTNQYPNLAERALPRIEREDTTPRAASAFEQIRLRTERHAARTGHTPRFLLLEAGDMKMRKARSAFATNFFGCAGFEIETSDALTGDPDAIVLCSSDAEYASLAPRVIQGLRAAGKSTPVIVAGNPADSIEQLQQAGVADFVHIRSNVVEVLRAWQERLGVQD